MFAFPVSEALFLSPFPLSLRTEVFVNFHLCQHIIIPGLRCLLVQLHLTSLGRDTLKTVISAPPSSPIRIRCGTLPADSLSHPSLLQADDHPDCPQRYGHMTAVIQLVTESAPTSCRLAQEVGGVGDSRSTGAFPASSSVDCASLWCHLLHRFPLP